MNRETLLVSACAGALVLAAAFTRAQAPTRRPGSGYVVVGRLPFPGAGTWDHVTTASAARRLYVAHADHVDVLDLDVGRLAGVLRGTPDVHGVALAPALGRGYTSDGGDSSLTVFDPATLAVRGRVRLPGGAPDGIAYDPATRRVFALHGTGPSLSVVDAGADTVRATVALGGAPDGAVADGRGRVYVTLKDRSELLVLDSHRLTVGRRWALAPCAGPDAVALADAGRTVWLGCDNGVAVAVDAADGRVRASFPIGAGVDGIALDRRGAVLVACGDGTVTVARRAPAGAYRVAGVVRTPRGARTLAIDDTTGRVYLPTAQFAAAAEPRAGPPAEDAPTIPGTFRLVVLGPTR